VAIAPEATVKVNKTSYWKKNHTYQGVVL